jgi:cation-transporting ATPase E
MESEGIVPSFRTPDTGLGAEQVRDRVKRGLTNSTKERTSRSFGEIARANILTRFNAILGAMLAVIAVVGPIQDALFGIVLVTNALIGIVQELRAKRVLDRLAVLSAPKARAVRDGALAELAVEEVVQDDLLELRAGDQVPADGVVRAVSGLEIDESLLTGESDPVVKDEDDEILSGSIVVAGSGRFQATKVGDEAYARRLASEARRFELVSSELVSGINRILRYVTWVIFPAAGLLLFSQLYGSTNVPESLRGTVAGVVGMVPQGLVLLTSIAFAVASIRLAHRKVLVQELPAVEGLARVDVVCFDKTGTITDGNIVFERVEPLAAGLDVESALGALASDENRNATMAALAAAFTAPMGWSQTGSVPFSSARKWSAASFGERATWVIGAPEIVWPGRSDRLSNRAEELAAAGQRVLLLARSENALDGEALPDGLEPAALVVLEEQIRLDAAETLRYFSAQGVRLKLISGDSPRTVGAVAQRVGFEAGADPFDARELSEDAEELADVLEQHSVFGRVTPHQKQAMVKALQSRGHVVAMTGDGVNDALALKLADIGLAMGSGAPATRAVAQLVLVDGRFSTMPGVVAEGRRVVANIERVANLFITKTVWATLLAITVGALTWSYPFLPRHLSIIDSLTIGIPAFFIALAPNTRRYIPGFVDRVLRFAVPAGLIAAAATFSVFAALRESGYTLTEQRTGAAVVMMVASLWVLVILARPITFWRALLVGAMIVGFVLLFPFPQVRDFAALSLHGQVLVGALAAGLAVVAVLETGWQASRRLGRGPAAAIVAGTAPGTRAQP